MNYLTLKPIIEVSQCKGINNVSDITRVPGGKGTYLVQADNVDIDDDRMLHRRKGATLKAAGSFHSLWANRDGSLAFVVKDDSILCRVNPDYSLTELITGVNLSTHVQYVETKSPDRIYFCNMAVIGYYDMALGQTASFPEPQGTNKKRMVGGQLMEVFNSRLYTANDRKVFFSDANVMTQRDEERGFHLFDGRVTMLQAVSDGMYLSDSTRCYFMPGKDPFESLLVEVTDVPAVEGTAAKSSGEDIGEQKIGRAVYWLTEVGIYMGTDGGQVKLLTPSYNFEEEGVGHGFLKSDRGYLQYIAMVETT